MKQEPYTVPSVVQKHGNRTAIIVSKARTMFSVVELTSTRLLLKKYDAVDLEAFGYKPTDYDVITAVEKYLKHNAGVTPNAKAALEEVIDLAFLL